MTSRRTSWRRDEAGAAHLATFRGSNDPEIMGNFLGLPGSAIYTAMADGVTTYRLYRLRKPASAAA